MSTTILTAALLGMALLGGAEPEATTTTTETPAKQETAAPAGEAPAKSEDETGAEPAKDETEAAEETTTESTESPGDSNTSTRVRVGAFWFVSIGK